MLAGAVALVGLVRHESVETVEDIVKQRTT